MEAYRLTHARYAEDISGYGAYKVGGRWNPKGYYALYLAEHPCGSILETLVHVPPQLIPDDYSIVRYEIQESLYIKNISEPELPKNWRVKNYDLKVFQNFGKVNLFDKELLGIYIHSSVSYPSHNYILNPNHKEFQSSIKIMDIKPYFFDPRLIQLFKYKK
ncbi:MAG: RES domain-containing protein [Calditrichales bacterium]|nr:RES domain-containing protein [Calditrichales bacterium]